jgi:hypothetical protein
MVVAASAARAGEPSSAPAQRPLLQPPVVQTFSPLTFSVFCSTLGMCQSSAAATDNNEVICLFHLSSFAGPDESGVAAFSNCVITFDQLWIRREI